MSKKPNKSGKFPWQTGLFNPLAKAAHSTFIATSIAFFMSDLSAAITLGYYTLGVTFSTGFAGEWINHKFDDPSPIFDYKTTFLFDLVGMVFCFLLFVIPAMRLDVAISPGELLPGPFGLLAFGLSAFLVTILRGLLVNLELVAKADV